MKINDRLLALADRWAVVNDRSVATLASNVARDGKMFDRLRGGAGCNVATAERFFAFFRAGENWPGGVVPVEVGGLLDGVDLGVHVHADTVTGPAASPGNAPAFSPMTETADA